MVATTLPSVTARAAMGRGSRGVRAGAVITGAAMTGDGAGLVGGVLGTVIAVLADATAG